MATNQYVDVWDAKNYREFRRDYPEDLMKNIVSYLKEKFSGSMDVAIDVGCGSGQSTVGLAPFFQQVHGLDVSASQIQQAELSHSLPNIKYLVSPSEQLPFSDNSVQLVTAATSMHWFKLDAFLPEVRRILSNNGVLAVFSYHSMKPLLKDDDQHQKIGQLYRDYFEMLRPYFSPGIKILINKYQTVNFPFEEIVRKQDFRHTFPGCFEDVVNYASTFSGLQNLRNIDNEKADEYLSTFKMRLYNIAAESNILPTQQITLYIDYLLVFCRKINED